VGERTQRPHGHTKARDLSFEVFNNRRSEEDHRGPVPLLSSHTAKACGIRLPTLVTMYTIFSSTQFVCPFSTVCICLVSSGINGLFP
jgi:hypothetical protein